MNAHLTYSCSLRSIYEIYSKGNYCDCEKFRNSSKTARLLKLYYILKAKIEKLDVPLYLTDFTYFCDYSLTALMILREPLLCKSSLASLNFLLFWP